MKVISVKFKENGRSYYFDPCDFEIKEGDYVIVTTARGTECGEVVRASHEVPGFSREVKPVIRVADAVDIRRMRQNRTDVQQAYTICEQRIAAHGLKMKLVDAEYTLDRSKLVFYFTADNRVDFRELVKDLASQFHTRIELRQIGVRDESKMLGGLGLCGQPFCCSRFLKNFQPVSIKMAKEQNLSLNPTKISGQCGRLMCCLKYEQDYYEETLKKLPKVGKEVLTPDGVGNIVEINVLRERVKVKLRLSDDTFDVREYPIDDVKRVEGKAFSRPEPKKPESAPQKEKAKEVAEEPPKAARKRYPRQKAPKNLSTDQFIERERERNRQNAGAVDSEE